MTTGFYVARDRARRFAHLLQRAQQERRLAYRGDEVGMASLRNEALELLAALLQESRASIDDVLAARLRDRERGYMDIPFVVMAEGVRERAALALRLEQARTARNVPESAAQQAVLTLLAAAERRIDAFCAAYDEKRPLSAARPTDVGRLLHLLEADHAWERTLRPRVGGAPFDTPPPEVPTSPDALDDLLRAARAALPEPGGPWRVTRGRAGEPLVLALAAGPVDGASEPLPVPPRLERAVRVLLSLHPVSVEVRGRRPAAAAPARRDWGAEPGAATPPPSAAPEPVVTQVLVRLPDPAAGGEALAAGAGAGAEARLAPAAEKAVRALLAAPPLPEGGAVPPARTVALLGLLKAFDAELLRVLLPRLGDGDLRAAAREVPREASRKAPVRRDVAEALTAALPGFPAGRLEEVLEEVAAGKAGRRRCVPLDAAVLLAVFGRTFVVGGWKAVRSLRVDPLTDAEVLALAAELLEVAHVRKDLEGGKGVEAAAVTRLERAAMAALGRLGRLA